MTLSPSHPLSGVEHHCTLQAHRLGTKHSAHQTHIEVGTGGPFFLVAEPQYKEDDEGQLQHDRFLESAGQLYLQLQTCGLSSACSIFLPFSLHSVDSVCQLFGAAASASQKCPAHKQNLERKKQYISQNIPWYDKGAH